MSIIAQSSAGLRGEGWLEGPADEGDGTGGVGATCWILPAAPNRTFHPSSLQNGPGAGYDWFYRAGLNWSCCKNRSDLRGEVKVSEFTQSVPARGRLWATQDELSEEWEEGKQCWIPLFKLVKKCLFRLYMLVWAMSFKTSILEIRDAPKSD